MKITLIAFVVLFSKCTYQLIESKTIDSNSKVLKDEKHVDKTRLFPDRLHCIASITKTSKDDSDKRNFYRVDEYVDMQTYRSSLSLYSRHDGKTRIYYNQVDDGEKSAPRRKFVLYDVNLASCRLEFINKWALAFLRNFAIKLHRAPITDNRVVDVPIGPSALLYLVGEIASDFKFIKQVFSNSRLIEVDVYRLQTGRREMLVQVPNRGNSEDERVVGDSLASAAKRAESFKISSICIRELTDNGDAERNADERLDCGLNKSYEFLVEFELIGEFSFAPDSLMGQRLEQQRGYEFEREPFMQPTGMACWPTGLDSEAGQWAARWQGSLTRNLYQMSAEYVSQYGSRGVSYAAYDGRRSLLRLDRNGRKNIYDLRARRSYHVAQWSWTRESDESNLEGADKGAEACVALKISDSDPLSSGDAMRRLIGLHEGAQLHHLGSRTVDQQSYEVFEGEIGASEVDTLPIVLERTKFKLPRSQSAGGKRYLLTFYVQVYPDASAGLDWAADSTGGGAEGQPSGEQLVPRYIELWQFDQGNNQRDILNRVEFLQFSWSLDVDPSNDPASQRGLGRVFDMRQCYEDRSQQADLRLRMVSADKVRSRDRLEGLREQRQSISEAMHEHLADVLEISRLNVVELDVEVQTSGTLMVTTRLAELISGISYMEPLGAAHFSTDTLLDDHLIRVFHNRHSIEECQLDSYGWWRANWLAYCPRLTICILLKQEDGLKQRLSESSKSTGPRADMAAGDSDRDLCHVYDFRWAKAAEASELSDGAVSAAEAGQYQLEHWEFKFRYRYRDSKTRRIVHQTYAAKCDSKSLTRLSSSGDSRALSGLSYSTMSEEPDGHNMNDRLALGASTKDSFRSCQLACQMNDFCGSFSICLRRRDDLLPDKPDDCVLSTVRLTGERLAHLVSEATRHKKENKFLIRLTGETNSQVLMMYRDESCSLHSKDFTAVYGIKRTMQSTKTLTEDNQNGNFDSKSNSVLLQNLLPGTQRPAKTSGQVRHFAGSLDECAGTSFESGLFNDPAKVNFTYCPLDAACFIGASAAQVFATIEHSSGLCYLWKKRLTQFYDVKRMLYMSVREANASRAEGERKKKSISDQALEKAREGLATILWNLDEENCARDCNLHGLQCLAFDSCRHDSRHLCILYHVRSPAAPQSLRLPLLEREKSLNYKLSQEQDDDTRAVVELAEKSVCDHYSLKMGYFEVRLRLMLDHERRAKMGEKESIPGEIGKFEDDALDRDRKASDAQLRPIEDEEKRRSEAGNIARISHSSGGIHWLAALIGAIFGLLGTMYSEEIVRTGCQPLLWLRTRSSHGNDGLNQLVLNENL